jgi:hypothetical protein
MRGHFEGKLKKNGFLSELNIDSVIKILLIKNAKNNRNVL